MIPSKTVDEIINVSRVEEVIEDYVTLKRRGSNMIGLCPFHDEKTPSFMVSPAKGIYKCFGCGKAGNSVGFVMEHESLSFPEALRHLAKKYNITIEEREETQEERESKQLTDSYYIVNEFANKYFGDKLFNTDEGKSVGLSYFKERGFLESTIKKFDLGFSINDRNSFLKYAIQKSYKKDHLLDLGLVTKKDNDFFRARVMFAIHNLSGKIIAFAGRTLSTNKNSPKYINSPESAIYNKRKILYGLYFAKSEVRKLDECLMVEGYTDVITLFQGGVKNVVASSGTSLTVEQIRLVKRFTNNIKIIYDGDAAGVKAALRGLDLVLEQDMNVRLVLLPDGEDPDSYLKSVGSEKFKEYLEQNQKDFVLFKLDILLKEAKNDPIKKSEVLHDIVDSIAKIPDVIKRSIYVTQCSIALNIEEQLLSSEVDKAVKSNLRTKQTQYEREQQRKKYVVREKNDDGSVPLPSEESPSSVSDDGLPPIEVNQNVSGDEYQERDLIRILFTGGDKMYDEEKGITIAQYLLHNIQDNVDDFDNLIYQRVMKMAIDNTNNNVVFDVKTYTNHEDLEIQKTAIDAISEKYHYANWEEKGVYLQTQKKPEDNFVKDSLESILRFKLRKIKKIITEVERQIISSEGSDEDKILNIKVLQQLQKERNELAAEVNMTVFPS